HHLFSEILISRHAPPRVERSCYREREAASALPTRQKKRKKQKRNNSTSRNLSPLRGALAWRAAVPENRPGHVREQDPDRARRGATMRAGPARLAARGA